MTTVSEFNFDRQTGKVYVEYDNGVNVTKDLSQAITGVYNTTTGLTVLDDASRAAIGASGLLVSQSNIIKKFAASRTNLNKLVCFGDSYASGQGATVPATGGYPALVAASKGGLFGAGSTAVSVPANTVGKYVTNVTNSDYYANINPNDVFYGMVGLNDIRTYDLTNEAYLNFNKLAQAATLAFFAVPNQFRIPLREPSNRAAGNSLLTFTGTWNHTPGDGRRSYGSFSSNATVSYTPAWAWDTAYIIAWAATGSTGSFTVNVDGVAVGKYTTTSPYAQAVSGWEPYLISIKVPKGVHSFQIVSNSDTVSLSDLMFFDSATVDGPLVIASGCANLSDTNWAVVSTIGTYTNVKPNDPANATGAGAWSATWKPLTMYGAYGVKRLWQATREVVEWLQRDGLNVVYLDAARNLDINNHFPASNVHPNDAGHQAIASEFIGALNLLT